MSDIAAVTAGGVTGLERFLRRAVHVRQDGTPVPSSPRPLVQEVFVAAPRAVVIDCDPGVDDALCIALALASPELDVVAVTTVAGNAAVDVTTYNATGLLAQCGRTDIPVAVGARRPLVHAYDHGLPPPHGENGVGGARLAPAVVAPVREHAVYLLRDLLRAAEPKSITILATAPLTNVALLASLHPELLDRIDQLVIMGGSAGRGNITPTAEFNIWTDPESAQRVLSDPAFDICLVGLDVTRRATLTPQHLQVLEARSPLGALLAEMVRGYRDRNEAGWPIHDAVTAAAVIDPTLLGTVPVAVEVDTSTGPGRGQTICEFTDGAPPRAVGQTLYAASGQVRLAVELDVEGFQRLMIDRLARPELAASAR